MPERHRGAGRGALRLFGGPLVVGLCGLLLAGALVVAALEVLQTNRITDNLTTSDALVEANIRILGQTQVELLRLRNLVADPETTPDVLALHRGFVLQRYTEARRSNQVGTLLSMDRYQQEVGRIIGIWDETVAEPLDRLVRGAGNDADRAAVVEGLTRIEREFNDVTAWTEIERRQLAGLARDQIGEVVVTNRWLAAGQATLLGMFGLVLVLAGRQMMRTDRQRSAAARRTEMLNTELRTISEVASRNANGVVICAPDGATLWINDAFTRLTGLTATELASRPHWELLMDSEFTATLAASIATGEAGVREIDAHSVDGRQWRAGVEVQPVTDEEGTLVHVIVIYTDVTAQRELEEHLRAAARDAQEAADAKASFLATMSHEIRTPLVSVLAMTELLVDSGLEADQLEYARSAHNGGRLLLDLVNDILTFSRVEAGQIQIEGRAFEPTALAEEVVELLASQAGEERVSLEVVVDPAVPAAVTGDMGRLRQILLNLVGNGIKFAPGGTVRISVVTSGEPDCVDWVVADDGIGIPPHRIEAVLAPFTQVDASVSRVHGGSGLGLAICTGLAQAMGGSLALESVEGVGTTVTVRLPMPQATVPVSAPAAADGTHEAPAPMRVLVAEDNPMNQRVASLFLERLGIEARMVGNGREAVEAVMDEDVDVILMDLHMPVCDGITAAREIRDALPEQRRPYIVALTADVAAAGADWPARDVMDAALTKPYTLNALADTLAAAAMARAGGGVRSAPGDAQDAVART